MANPEPGARVEQGNAIVQGIAMDTRAPEGSVGIDRIDFFLDNRDSGGLNIGTAVPGIGPEPFGPGSFQATLSLPNLVGGYDLFVYAHDSVTGQETIYSEPIALGEDPSKAFIAPFTATGSEVCTSVAGATVGNSPTSTATEPGNPEATTTETTATTEVTATSPTAQNGPSVTFEVSNPSPGDTLHVGGYVMQGVAFDPEAESGTGIDQIQVFLGNRDEGGTLVGQGTFEPINLLDNQDDGSMIVGGEGENVWIAEVTFPSSQTGARTLWFYAHSAITGHEAVLSVPVTLTP